MIVYQLIWGWFIKLSFNTTRKKLLLDSLILHYSFSERAHYIGIGSNIISCEFLYNELAAALIIDLLLCSNFSYDKCHIGPTNNFTTFNMLNLQLKDNIKFTYRNFSIYWNFIHTLYLCKIHPIIKRKCEFLDYVSGVGIEAPFPNLLNIFTSVCSYFQEKK